MLAIGGAVLAVAAVVAVALALTLPDGEVSVRAAGVHGAHRPEGPVALGDDWLRAIHLASYEPDGYAQPAFVDALRRAKADGATHVVLHPLLETPDRSSELASKADAPTDETLWPASRSPTARASRPLSSRISRRTTSTPAPSSRTPTPSSRLRASVSRHTPRSPAEQRRRGRRRLDALAIDGADYTDRWSAILTDTRERCDCR